MLRGHRRDRVRLLAEVVGGRRVVAGLLPWLGARERGPSLRPLAPSGPPSGAELVFLERRVAAPLVAGVEGDGLAVALDFAIAENGVEKATNRGKGLLGLCELRCVTGQLLGCRPQLLGW